MKIKYEPSDFQHGGQILTERVKELDLIKGFLDVDDCRELAEVTYKIGRVSGSESFVAMSLYDGLVLEVFATVDDLCDWLEEDSELGFVPTPIEALKHIAETIGNRVIMH